MRIELPWELVEASVVIGRMTTPERRTSGVESNLARGVGDAMAWRMAHAFLTLLHEAGRTCSIETTVGGGDTRDASTWSQGRVLLWNLKASARPYSGRMNLQVPDREKRDGMNGYVQAFEAPDDLGAFVFAGWVAAEQVWKMKQVDLWGKKRPQDAGRRILVEELSPMARLIEFSDGPRS